MRILPFCNVKMFFGEFSLLWFDGLRTAGIAHFTDCKALWGIVICHYGLYKQNWIDNWSTFHQLKQHIQSTLHGVCFSWKKMREPFITSAGMQCILQYKVALLKHKPGRIIHNKQISDLHLSIYFHNKTPLKSSMFTCAILNCKNTFCGSLSASFMCQPVLNI